MSAKPLALLASTHNSAPSPNANAAQPTASPAYPQISVPSVQPLTSLPTANAPQNAPNPVSTHA